MKERETAWQNLYGKQEDREVKLVPWREIRERERKKEKEGKKRKREMRHDIHQPKVKRNMTKHFYLLGGKREHIEWLQ